MAAIKDYEQDYDFCPMCGREFPEQELLTNDGMCGGCLSLEHSEGLPDYDDLT